ncbi:vang-like protein 2-B [Chrysoperla carnea]|uniref:vang-like protein 2-B n=1 Tax=Chrysoperla carnea TaxID=189513 RepID=UPI001D08D5E6|nr:vang-like protein 2-B [Chrysoperla carnea]
MGSEAIHDMETESVKSEQSSRSRRSRTHRDRDRDRDRTTSNHRQHSHRSTRSNKSTILQRNKDAEHMAPSPYQTTVTMIDSGNNGGNNNQEIIEVQILPQDDNWGENTTAITGNTSDQSQSMEDVLSATTGGTGGHGGLWSNDLDTFGSVTLNDGSYTFTSYCMKYLNNIITLLLSLTSIISPVLMVILPKLGIFTALSSSTLQLQRSSTTLQHLQCNAECKGLLISLIFKLIILIIGSYMLFIRQRSIKMPYIYIYKIFILLLIFISTFTYWLFYYIQVTEVAQSATTLNESVTYQSLVSYAIYLTDTLLLIHYLAVILIELKHLQPMYYIKIIRSPDGQSRSYPIGEFSIQRAAVFVLERYYTDFPIYNPYLERIPTKRHNSGNTNKNHSSTASFKFYEVDNVATTNNTTLLNNVIQQRTGSTCNTTTTSRNRRDSSHHNERFYEEHEYERRVKKRKARLITAAEESFTHIKRLNHNEFNNTNGTGQIPMDSQEAAQAIFPSMARALQKYLRVTRQQPQHTVDSILQHLSNCLKHDLTARAFLEPYLVQEPVLQNDKEQEKQTQTWALISDQLLSRSIQHNCCFQLRQNDISLLCTIKQLPNFNLTEHIVDVKSNKFVLRLNSETSV